MISLALRLGGWISRNGLMIIVSIVLCTVVLHTLAELKELRQSIETVNAAQEWLRNYAMQQQEGARETFKKAGRSGSAALDKQIAGIAKDIAERRASIKAIGMTLTPNEVIEKAKLQVEIEALGQLRHQLAKLRAVVFEGEELERHRTACINLNAAVQNDLKSLNKLDAQISHWDLVQRGRSHVDPSSDEYKIAQRRDELDESVRRNSQSVTRCVKNFRTLKARRDRRPPIGALTFSDGWADAALAEIEKLKAELDGRWLEKARRAVSDEAQGPYAKQATRYVALGAIGTAAAWILVRVIFYFVLAPAASRATPVRLLPNVKGHAELLRRPRSTDSASGDGPSASLPIQLEPDQVIAVQPQYFHGASGGCIVSPISVLNRRCLRASVDAGLYNLTQVRAERPATVTVSVGHEPLQQLAVLDIPSGSAVTMQPEHVIGAVHRRESPVTITRHLRLLNLQAWLTLRFRYLVFHGPVQLILKGCRGIKAESVESERTIDRGYMMGFSANLSHGVVETETFAAYLTSKKGLLRERFRGGPGILISEESPSATKKKGPRKRGLEDLADSAVNAAGSVS